jgi:hypothetical protein
MVTSKSNYIFVREYRRRSICAAETNLLQSAVSVKPLKPQTAIKPQAAADGTPHNPHINQSISNNKKKDDWLKQRNISNIFSPGLFPFQISR